MLSPGIANGEKYQPAMEITDQVSANRYFADLVDHAMSFGLSHADAVKREKSSVAYYAGYFSDETRERVERLFNCEHPYFGAIAKKGPPTEEEAFKIGYELGLKTAQKRIQEQTKQKTFGFNEQDAASPEDHF